MVSANLEQVTRKVQSRMNRMRFFRIKPYKLLGIISMEDDDCSEREENPHRTSLGLTFQGCTLQVSIFSGTDPVASNHIHIQILIGTVFGSLHFSLGVLSTVFSFNGTALCRSGYVLKITALKNLNFFKMSSRILVIFWHAYSYRADFIIKLFEVVLYTGSSYSSNFNILSNFQWCSFFFIK